jgi:predicted CXXCH cytochrome family protein
MVRVKLYVMITAVLVFMLSFTTSAFAWTHGQFNATTDACAGCHVAHAAEAPKLLKTGPTQTEFCFLCHGDGGTSAPYDVKDGFTVAGGTYQASTAGGFVRQFAGMVGGLPTFTSVTSRHNVWGLVGETGYEIDQSVKVHQIPGGTGTDQIGGSGFVCGSCHDPHDGGATPSGNYSLITGSATSPNPRLLRREIKVVDPALNDLYVCFGMETMGTYTNEGVVSGVYRVARYAEGSTRWCGACHNKFQTDDADTNPGEGHAVFLYDMWRHPMELHVIRPPDFNDTIATGTPLEADQPGAGNKILPHVACLTCHRAHSTTAAMDGWAASWPRDLDLSGPGATSALLRMDSRGVCYNCHGAAQYNCWADARIDCSLCHPYTGGGDGHHSVRPSGKCNLCHYNLWSPGGPS